MKRPHTYRFVLESKSIKDPILIERKIPNKWDNNLIVTFPEVHKSNSIRKALDDCSN